MKIRFLLAFLFLCQTFAMEQKKVESSTLLNLLMKGFSFFRRDPIEIFGPQRKLVLGEGLLVAGLKGSLAYNGRNSDNYDGGTIEKNNGRRVNANHH
ncbi:hypothetical protein K7432_003106 [Basidiobolus ranarum]|uniref:Uncharacterized protein n=1 Tax=Basidiobolus ranarum TaxID=34480 RepID=A0ABR2W763_9FUNG